MKLFGLIGYPLTHSFSKKYFTDKFEKERIKNCRYELFEMENVDEALPSLVEQFTELKGLNVTIPHKQSVLKHLSEIDPAAKKIGAVNVIKVLDNGKGLKGYNSDYYGFKLSLEKFLTNDKPIKALVLGTGGASKAVWAALEDMNIEFLKVSRNTFSDCILYDQLTSEILNDHLLIVNTTPLGMHPNEDTAPSIDYESITPDHYFYDLVYNPATTKFMKLGQSRGAKTINGLEMLKLQAEKSWDIWNS